MADSSEPPRPPPSPPSDPIAVYWTRLMRAGYVAWLVATFGVLGYLTGWQLDRQVGGWTGRVTAALVGVLIGAMLATALRRRRGATRQ